MGTWEHRNIAGSPPPQKKLPRDLLLLLGNIPQKYKEK
jgi:hypothetical protein